MKFVAGVVVGAALLACGGPAEDPEQRLHALIESAEQAAEARSIGTLKEMVSPKYSDPRGYDRNAVVRIVQLHLMRHGAVHLLTVVKDLRVADQQHGRAEILVAMAARPIDSVSRLHEVRAELMRFDIFFEADGDGDWAVVSADWRRAHLEDFL